MIIEEKIRVNRPQVVDDTIDGETIIVNLRNGNYYSFDHLGVLIWEVIDKKADMDRFAELLTERYDVTPERIQSAIREFVASLFQEGLVVGDTSVEDTAASMNEEEMGELLRELPANFLAPTLNKYADMQDMLLLDPIHDTDEKGWPKGKIDE